MKTYLLTTAVLMACLATANAGKINLMCPQGDAIKPVIEHHKEGVYISSTGEVTGTISVYANQTSPISFDIITAAPIILPKDKAQQIQEDIVEGAVELKLIGSGGDNKGNFFCNYNVIDTEVNITLGNVTSGGVNTSGRHRYKCDVAQGTPGGISCKTSS